MLMLKRWLDILRYLPAGARCRRGNPKATKLINCLILAFTGLINLIMLLSAELEGERITRL